MNKDKIPNRDIKKTTQKPVSGGTQKPSKLTSGNGPRRPSGKTYA